MLNHKSGNSYNGNTLSSTKRSQQSGRSNHSSYPKSETVSPRSSDCLFCEDDSKKIWKEKFNVIINQALYSKYSFSQNYFYTKDINEIFGDSRSSFVIKYKDNLHFDEEEEYLKRYYHDSEYDVKIKMLTEYYKFHNDIARLFMLPTTNVLNKYHDNKRRLEYIRITKLFKEEEENCADKSAQQDLKIKNYSISDKFLADLDITDSRESYRQIIAKNEKNSLLSNEKSPSTTASMKRASISKKIGFEVIPNKKEKKVECSVGENSNSRTLIDLNNKLGVIINSRSHINDTNYLESIDQTMTNLTSFLTFMNKKLTNSRIINEPQPQKTTQPEFIPTRLQLKQDSNSRPETRLEHRVEPREEEIKKSFTNKSTKEISGGNLVDRVLNPSAKLNVNHNFSKITPRSHKEVETEKKKPEVKQSAIKKPASAKAPVKFFEEAAAVKIALQTHQRKNTMQPSSSRDSLRENPPISNTLKYLEEARLSKQNFKPKEDKSQELRTSKNHSKNSISGVGAGNILATSTVPIAIAKTKTKSIDLHTKITDLLLENNQPLLGNMLQKKEEIYQVLKNTNSSENLKAKRNAKSPNRQSQAERLKADLKLSLHTKVFGNLNQMIVQRAASDLIQAKTDREQDMKRLFTLDNLELIKREAPQGSLSARAGTANPQSKAREAEKNKSRGPLRTRTPHQSDAEQLNIKSNITTNQKDDRKKTLHKSNKSENRLRKVENFEKSDIANTSRPWLNDNNVRNKTGHKSPLKQNYMNNNEFHTMIPNSTQNKSKEKSVISKTERQAYQERLLDSRDDYMTKIIKVRSPETGGVHSQTNRGFQKTLELDFSPLRIPQRDNLLTTKARSKKILMSEKKLKCIVMSSRTPTDLNNEYQHLRKSQVVETQRSKKK